MKNLPRLHTLAALILLAGACSQGAAPPDQEAAPGSAAPPAAPVTSLLQGVAALGIPNVHEPAPGLLTGGQPTEAQLDALARAGFTTFVSLRLPDEEGAGWEEAYARARGVSFSRLPVAGTDGLTRQNVEALDAILKAAGGAHTVVYCGSANRAGALLALRAGWLEGATPEDALALGKAAGLTRLEADVARLLGMEDGAD